MSIAENSLDLFQTLANQKSLSIACEQVLHIEEFYVDQSLSETKSCIFLYDKMIFCESVTHNNVNYNIKGLVFVIQFSFDLKFQMLYTSDNYSVSNLKGVRFLKHNLNDFFFYFKESTEEKNKITKILRKFLVERGFHQYFKPVKKLGAGSFATVFEIKRYSDNKRFAVKAFSKQQLFSSNQGKESLINQLEILRNLNHKNVLKLEGVYESDNSIYVALQLISGQHFFSYLQKMEIVQFTPEQIYGFMKNFLSGLNHLHKKRIMHRDLKPENIMLRNGNIVEPIIVDFGLGTHCDIDEYLFYRCGTPGYIAPEIIALRDNKQHVQPACDVFSAAAIFHILITGRTLFQGNRYEEVYQRNKTLQFNINASQIKERTNNEYAYDLLTRMLQKNPYDRISIEQAQCHPYFTSNILQSYSPTHTEIEQKLLIGRIINF